MRGLGRKNRNDFSASTSTDGFYGRAAFTLFELLKLPDSKAVIYIQCSSVASTVKYSLSL